MVTNAIQVGMRQVGDTLSKNSPTILTGLAVGGLITTVVLGIRATPRALDLIEQECIRREVSGDPDYIDPTSVDIIKLTWKQYIPTAVMGVATIACIIGSNSINLRRTAALGALYSLADTTLKEYQAKVVEQIGKGKELKVRDDIAQDKLNDHPIEDRQVIITGKGNCLCFDVLSGRYFLSDIETLRKVENDFNHRLISDMFISLNELYADIGLTGIQLGGEIGWTVEFGLLEFKFSSKLATDGQPCVVVEYRLGPHNI